MRLLKGERLVVMMGRSSDCAVRTPQRAFKTFRSRSIELSGQRNTGVSLYREQSCHAPSVIRVPAHAAWPCHTLSRRGAGKAQLLGAQPVELVSSIVNEEVNKIVE